MKKIVYGSVLAIICFIMLFFAPDFISMVFVGIMIVLCAVGYGIGIVQINRFSEGFAIAITKIEEIKKISVSENWLYIKQIDSLFHNQYLDFLFSKYAKKVEQVKREQKTVIPDVENYVNEDYLSLKCQKNFLNVIPGTLTGLGILGTFYGLINGLGGIHFSSVDVVVDSISTLVGSIDTAFYTSIAGVALSLVFEIILKISWNDMLISMMDFYDKFHNKIFASEQEQKDALQMNFYKKVFEYIERNRK